MAFFSLEIEVTSDIIILMVGINLVQEARRNKISFIKIKVG